MGLDIRVDVRVRGDGILKGEFEFIDDDENTRDDVKEEEEEEEEEEDKETDVITGDGIVALCKGVNANMSGEDS